MQVIRHDLESTEGDVRKVVRDAIPALLCDLSHAGQGDARIALGCCMSISIPSDPTQRSLPQMREYGDEVRTYAGVVISAEPDGASVAVG